MFWQSKKHPNSPIPNENKYALIVGLKCIVAIIIWGLFINFGPSFPSSSSSSSETPKEEVKKEVEIINPNQALQLIRGCCKGAGGTYSSTGQDCIAPDYNAFDSCLGDVEVQYPNGNQYPLNAGQLSR